jgi:hypothetical protein
MIPNTKLGGCQKGFLSESYQPLLLSTQRPDNPAYATTMITARVATAIEPISR